MKKLLNLLLISTSVVLLSACNNINKESSSNENITSIKLLNSSGTYIGKFDSSTIDININGEKRMFKVVSDIQNLLNDIKSDSTINFSYEETDKGELVIHSITHINNKPVSSTLTSSTKDKERNENKVYENKSTKYTTYSVTDDFVILNDTIYLRDDVNFKAKIENLDYDTEIRKERWKAASELEENGILKELVSNGYLNSNFQRAEFIFAGYEEEKNKYIAVRWNNNELFKFTIEVPLDDNYDELEFELWNIISDINLK